MIDRLLAFAILVVALTLPAGHVRAQSIDACQEMFTAEMESDGGCEGLGDIDLRLTLLLTVGLCALPSTSSLGFGPMEHLIDRCAGQLEVAYAAETAAVIRLISSARSCDDIEGLRDSLSGVVAWVENLSTRLSNSSGMDWRVDDLDLVTYLPALLARFGELANTCDVDSAFPELGRIVSNLSVIADRNYLWSGLTIFRDERSELMDEFEYLHEQSSTMQTLLQLFESPFNSFVPSFRLAEYERALLAEVDTSACSSTWTRDFVHDFNRFLPQTWRWNETNEQLRQKLILEIAVHLAETGQVASAVDSIRANLGSQPLTNLHTDLGWYWSLLVARPDLAGFSATDIRMDQGVAWLRAVSDGLDAGDGIRMYWPPEVINDNAMIDFWGCLSRGNLILLEIPAIGGATRNVLPSQQSPVNQKHLPGAILDLWLRYSATDPELLEFRSMLGAFLGVYLNREDLREHPGLRQLVWPAVLSGWVNTLSLLGSSDASQWTRWVVDGAVVSQAPLLSDQQADVIVAELIGSCRTADGATSLPVALLFPIQTWLAVQGPASPVSDYLTLLLAACTEGREVVEEGVIGLICEQPGLSDTLRELCSGGSGP